MVVYQPPVLELPVPIEAYRSVNRFVCIATSVVLVVSRKYLFLGTWSTRNYYVRDSSSTDAENAQVFHSHMRPESGLARGRHEMIYHAQT